MSLSAFLQVVSYLLMILMVIDHSVEPPRPRITSLPLCSFTYSRSVTYCSLKRGSIIEVISKTLAISGYLSEKSARIADRISLVIGLWLELYFKTEDRRRSRIGKIDELVTYFSPDMISMQSARGERASLSVIYDFLC